MSQPKDVLDLDPDDVFTGVDEVERLHQIKVSFIHLRFSSQLQEHFIRLTMWMNIPTKRLQSG
jgi:hypothetical protein